MVNSSYTYSDGNLLKNPQKYQMTPFLDKNFLNDYQRTRIELEKIIHNINQKDMQDDRSSKFNSVTSIMLFDVLTALINDENNNFDIIDKFIKKFETKKLIFSKYDDNLQPISNEYSELRNYLLLATICAIQKI